MDSIELHIEALIFASEESIGIAAIKQVLEQAFDKEFKEPAIIRTVETIAQKYRQQNLAIELVQNNGGYQFLTKKEYYPTMYQLQVQASKRKLSQAALETLAIVAYRQPVTKLEIEQIRGVNSDYTIQKLLEKELIAINGKAETVGKPLLYITSGLFMDYFGINSIAELPQLKEFLGDHNSVNKPI